jgi:FAD:protein FMN transferase
VKRFLVDGSGDVFYESNGEAIRAGLEHPEDSSKVIGVVTMTHGSLCGSGGNRRQWREYHHIIDPKTLRPSEGILATWVLADSATIADALATCLFLAEPDKFASAWRFEYGILNDDHRFKRSAGFPAELF